MTTSSLAALFEKLVSTWKCWVVVPPWDVGVRVRRGQQAVALGPGMYFRVPLLDEVTLVNTRLRVTTTPAVTMHVEGGMVRVVRASIGYRVRDPLLAVMTLATPESVVIVRAQALLLGGHAAETCRDLLHNVMALAGIDVDFVTYTENATVMAFRILQNHWDTVRDDRDSTGTGGRY